eukprot:TRINITY_DN8411_c0_g1_i1.p1 TRINITY_DN8411_c0_g1~~TRINITY_DN8411_c0_g1_i1.p1  ORF type:complete len:246 (-),score=52.32 TRINITY_DN8411_c0_g1_i1:47-748(-)
MSGAADPAALPSHIKTTEEEVRFKWENDINFGEGDRSDGWTYLQPQKKPHGAHFGPELGLAHKLKLGGVENIAFSKIAMGSTSLYSDWHPEAKDGKCYYKRMITFVKESIKQLEDNGHKVSIKGFFWMQGESDGNNATRSKAYEPNLKLLIQKVREDLSTPELIFVVGKIKWPKAKKMSVVNQSIANVAKNVSNVRVVETADLAAIGGGNHHFNAESLYKLGERMAESYLMGK